MSINIVLTLTVGWGILATYLLYKYVNSAKYPEFEYRVFECRDYTINSLTHVYKHNVPTGSFFDLETVYKKDFLGNCKIKERVDKMLINYLKKNFIFQKRVVIETGAYITDINIESNVNPNTLVFAIGNIILRAK
jgi:hypothetical protein